MRVIPQALFAVAAAAATVHKSRAGKVLMGQELVSLDETLFDMTSSSGVARGVLAAILTTMVALEMDTPCPSPCSHTGRQIFLSHLVWYSRRSMPPVTPNS